MRIERSDLGEKNQNFFQRRQETTPSVELSSDQLNARISEAIDEVYFQFEKIEKKHQEFLLNHPHAVEARLAYTDSPEVHDVWKPLETVVRQSDKAAFGCVKGIIKWWMQASQGHQEEAKFSFISMLDARTNLLDSVLQNHSLEEVLPIFSEIATTPFLANLFVRHKEQLGARLVVQRADIIPIIQLSNQADQIKIATTVNQAIRSHVAVSSANSMRSTDVIPLDSRNILKDLADQAIQSRCSAMVAYLLSESTDGHTWDLDANKETDVSTVFSPEGEFVTSSLKVIARDAIGCLDHDGSLLGIGFVDEARVPPRNVPSSTHLQSLLFSVTEQGRDPDAMMDMEDLYWTYEDEIKPYLSVGEQEEIEIAWKNKDKLVACCQKLLQNYHYEVVPCESVQTAISSLETRRDISDSVLLFEQLHRSQIQRHIEQDLGFPLTGLSLREQAQLLKLLQTPNRERYERFCRALQDYGEELAMCFLTGEENQLLADHLLEIAETVPRAQAQKLFHRCAEYLQEAEKTAHQMESAVFQKRTQIVERVRVEDVLFGQVIRNIETIVEEQAMGRSIDEMIDSLERMSPDLALLVAVTKTSLKGKDRIVPIHELKDVTIHSCHVQDLSEADRLLKYKEYESILCENWVAKGIDAMKQAVHGLEEGFTRATTKFFELRRKDQLIAFVRFDERPDLGENALYAGSFNTASDLKGAALGSLFFHEVLESTGKDHQIFAHVLATDPVASVYVEEFGFSIVGLERDKTSDGSEIPWFRIARAKAGEKAGIPSSIFVTSSLDRREEFLEWIERETSAGTQIARFERQKGSTQVKLTATVLSADQSMAA